MYGDPLDIDPRTGLYQLRHAANEFNAEQQLKERILARLRRAITTAEHQHDQELVAGLSQAKRIVEEA